MQCSLRPVFRKIKKNPRFLSAKRHNAAKPLAFSSYYYIFASQSPCQTPFFCYASNKNKMQEKCKISLRKLAKCLFLQVFVNM